jgi:NADH dehydrogenase FAD-containing subunit
LFQNKRNLVIQASAVQLEKNELILDQSVPEFGNSIHFDYLILATGTKNPAPAKATAIDEKEIRANLSKLRGEIKSAKNVVIVGGGPVGIELAGEIRDVYSKTKITIVHSEDGFLNASMSKIRQKLFDLTQKNKVDVIFKDVVNIPGSLKGDYYHPEGGVVETKNGKTIANVDLVLLAFGNRPESAWLKNSALGSSIIAGNGYVKVKKSLQVDHPELSHVFVLGDVADLDETKMAFRISSHVPVVVTNLLAVANDDKATAEYKKGADGMFVTFGKNGGAGVMPLFGGFAVGNWVVSTVKSKSLLVAPTWKTLNLKEPA